MPGRMRDADAVALACGANVTAVATTALGNFTMALRRPDFISTRIMKNGFWEIRQPSEMTMLADIAAPDSGIFIDIGGNIGWHSFLFAKYGWTVYTIEGMSANQRTFAVVAPRVSCNVAQKVFVIERVFVLSHERLVMSFVRSIV